MQTTVRVKPIGDGKNMVSYWLMSGDDRECFRQYETDETFEQIKQYVLEGYGHENVDLALGDPILF